MKGRRILNIYILTICTIFSLPCSLFAKILAGPYLQNPDKNGIKIRWISDDGKPGTIFYGVNLENKITNSDGEWLKRFNCFLHEVSLTNLQPATQYYYRIESGDFKTDQFSFKTAPQRFWKRLMKFVWLLLNLSRQQNLLN